MTSISRRYASFTAHEKPVTGDIKMSFVGYDHIGWLKCDGRSLSTKDFNLLFQVIGYTFGGSGNTFNLPNPQGAIVGTVGTNSIPVSHPAGQLVGEETHTLTIAEMPSHNHGTQTATAQPVNKYELTSNRTTGITIDASGNHTHTYTDAYFAEAGGGGTSSTVFGTSAGTDIDNKFYFRTNTGSYTTDPTIAAAQLSTSSNGLHTHSITDPGHNHTLAPVGGDQPHNNMQPTLFIGNTFIYSGIPVYPGFPPNPASAWPYTTGLVPPYI